MTSAEELKQYVSEVVENATSQRSGLSEQLDCLKLAKQQVQQSLAKAKDDVKSHFEKLKKVISKALDAREEDLLMEIEALEKLDLEPLQECEVMINSSLEDAISCIEQGTAILQSGQGCNEEALLKFKDETLSKDLHILPEVPSLSEVAYVGVDFSDSLADQLHDLVLGEGRIYDRAPVQITETEERPGGILVKWEEVEEELEVVEYCLQYCSGEVTACNSGKATFHTVYTGPHSSYLVRKLRTDMPYSFRVRCRSEDRWSIWSVPQVARTHIPHYQWDGNTEGYSTSNENKTGTRCSGPTRVLYSESQCYKTVSQLSFRILDSGEKSPVDGIGIAVTNDDMETLKREGAIFLSRTGAVFIDGQEMKTRLPSLSRNSTVTIETESLASGKVRLCIQLEDKELTFDWKIDRQVTLGMIGGLGMTPLTESKQCFFFGMIFSHEDWKVSVE